MLRGIVIIKLQKNFVVVKQIREWRQNKLRLLEPTVKPNKTRINLNQQLNQNKRLGGGRRKPLDLQLENQTVEWIYDRRSNGLFVLRKLIMAKAKYFYKRECDESGKSFFVASNG